MRYFFIYSLFVLGFCFSVYSAPPEDLGGSLDASETPVQANSVAPKHRKTLLEVGETAPDFVLSSDSGKDVRLSAYRGKKKVVLYFYPKDNTPGCTKEAESFRDNYERIEKAGAIVLGISVDDKNSHKAFVNKYNLNFPLLADTGGKVSAQYGVMGWIMAKRITYIIGKDGKVKSVFSDVDVNKHSEEILKIL